MYRIAFILGVGGQIFRWLVGAFILFAVCVSVGCVNFDLRGDSFQENDATRFMHQLRPPSDLSHPRAFSNKARQIEDGCGGP